MTSKVNYGNRPAGCVAIASVRQTAERFGAGREEPTWFIKNKMYVDATTGGPHDKERALAVSQDMEDFFLHRRVSIQRNSLKRGPSR